MLYLVTVSTMVCIYIILASGLNIITGYAGQPNLGHAAFFGIGAYASALLTTKVGLSFWAAMPLAVVIAASVGFVLGIISLRLREDFLAITTIGVNFVVVSVFLYFDYFGRALGLGGIPRPSIFGHVLNKPEYLVLVVFLVAAVLLVCWVFSRSRLGLMVSAVREDELAAHSLGLNVTALKLAAFVFGTALAGLGGSVYAHFMTFISPYDFAFPVSITVMCMVVLGGAGTFWGPVVGAIILASAPEIMRFIQQYRMLIYGGLLAVLMIFQPAGLLGADSVFVRGGARLVARVRGRVVQSG
ncbi:MAG: branched-chain amino acid ABC transporter permease [Bacillota bacterium]|nr:MAG: branched-chain amino acid ABC transporter permease [Bacillota bacterium]